jgi:hypothetical protein
MDDSTLSGKLPEKKGDAGVISKDRKKELDEKNRIPKLFKNRDSKEVMPPKEPLKPEILKQKFLLLLIYPGSISLSSALRRTFKAIFFWGEWGD